ncbi:hypothetical protein QFC22_005782 [Naganishia vaughanmartiniae]|uniref:Uncharacterized protein n=1 Tax=Naganishia vaughanmartiniae TaxID=1424756 RepID=A0ACC2WT05_9TREE|nr:hypothetical protein QFC22_005782 [Naganishia vaughanmartiniae]
MSFIVATLNRSAPRSVAPIVTPVNITTVGASHRSSSSWASTVDLASADNSKQQSQGAISLPEVPQRLLQQHATDQLPELALPANHEIAAPPDPAKLFAGPVVDKKTNNKKKQTTKKNTKKPTKKEKDHARIDRCLLKTAAELTRTEERDAEQMCFKLGCPSKQFRSTCFCDLDLANGEKCSNERTAQYEYCAAHLQEKHSVQAPRMARVQSAPARLETTPTFEYEITTRDTPIGWRRRPSLPISVFDVARRGPRSLEPLDREMKAMCEKYIVTEFYKAKQVMKRADAVDAWKAKFAVDDREVKAREGHRVVRGGFENAEHSVMISRDAPYYEAFLGLLKYELEPDEHQPEEDEEIISWILVNLEKDLEKQYNSKE